MVKNKYGKFMFDETRKYKIIDLYNNGNSCEQISNEFKVNAETIRRRLIEWNVDTCPIRYKCNHSFFKIIDNESKAYWLNFIAADGNIYENRLTIGLHYNDKPHLAKFKNDIASNHKIYNRKNSNLSVLRITSTEITNDLAKYNVVPNKSLILEPYRGISKNLERHYWRSFIDGDGCLVNPESAPATLYFVGTYSYCEAFKDWASKYTTSRSRIGRQGKLFRYTLSGNILCPVLKELYYESTVYLDRKYKLAMDIVDRYE